MALQINQYTKIRTNLTLDNDDLMDLDSTDDAGVSYESAKMTVANLLAFVNANADNIYIADGTIGGNRTLTANGNWTKWLLGDVKVANVADGNSFGFVVEFGVVEMGRYNYDVPSTSANIELKHLILGVPTTYFKAINGKVGIGTETPHVKLVTKGTPDQSLLTVMHLSNSLVDSTSAIGKGVGFTMGVDDGRYSAKIATVFEGNNPSYLFPALAFYTMYETSEIGTETEKLRISSNGNVGIGITTPTSKLHVQGGTPSTTKTLLIENSLLNPNLVVQDDGFVGIGIATQSGTEVFRVNGGRGLFDDSLDVIGDGTAIIMRVINSSFGDVLNINNDNSVNIKSAGSLSVGVNISAPTSTIYANGKVGGEGLFITNNVSLGQGILSVSNDNINVGIGVKTPNASAKLQIESTTQGFLKPRMTTVQRDAVLTPTAGLEVYNTTTNKMNFYNGSAWEAITSA